MHLMTQRAPLKGGKTSKGKLSHYRPRQARRTPAVETSRISREATHEGGKVVSPTHRPPLFSQEILVVLISVRRRVDPTDIVGPEGLSQ